MKTGTATPQDQRQDGFDLQRVLADMTGAISGRKGVLTATLEGRSIHTCVVCNNVYARTYTYTRTRPQAAARCPTSSSGARTSAAPTTRSVPPGLSFVGAIHHKLIDASLSPHIPLSCFSLPFRCAWRATAASSACWRRSLSSKQALLRCDHWTRRTPSQRAEFQGSTPASISGGDDGAL